MFGNLKIRSKLILATLGITVFPTIMVIVLFHHLFSEHNLGDDKTHFAFLTACFIAIVAGVVIAFVTARRITAPMDQLIEVARQVAWGSLSIDLQDLSHRNDEYGELANSFQEMATGLKSKIDLLQLSQKQMQVHNEQLKREIAQRKQAQQQKDQLHDQLISASREAGMAEIATAVLHNVGNVLNSINVSTTMITERINAAPLNHLFKISDLIREHMDDFPEYVKSNPQGQLLPKALVELSDMVGPDFQYAKGEIDLVIQGVERIKQIIQAQQSYVSQVDVSQSTQPAQVMKDALAINQSGIDQRGIRIVKDIHPLPSVTIAKHKVLQILVNLISNAKCALEHTEGDRCITVSAQLHDKGKRHILTYQVSDNGCGIAPENLDRIFSHGYSTHVDGRGYGLHYSILTATELGGTLTAQSPGVGKGATFTLSLPVKVEEPQVV